MEQVGSEASAPLWASGDVERGAWGSGNFRITWRGSFERRFRAPAPDSDAAGLGWGQEFAFLTNSQVTSAVLAQGPRFEQ